MKNDSMITSKTAKEIIENIKYLFGRINWRHSFLDAKAICIMNNLSKDIKNLENAK